MNARGRGSRGVGGGGQLTSCMHSTLLLRQPLLLQCTQQFVAGSCTHACNAGRLLGMHVDHACCKGVPGWGALTSARSPCHKLLPGSCIVTFASCQRVLVLHWRVDPPIIFKVNTVSRRP